MIIRGVFIVFNLVCFIVGGAILGIGIWMNQSSTSLIDVVINIEEFRNIELNEDVEKIIQELLDETILRDASYALIVLGSIVIGISYFGCGGAWKESKLFLMIYTIPAWVKN